MRVLAINSSARTGDVSKTEIFLNWLVEGMQSEAADVEVINIHRKRINYCKGCFVCWTRTPGRCVYRDDMTKELLPKYLAADLVIIATPLFHYTVNAKLKTFIERTLPMALPFFELRDGVTTHPLRQPAPLVVVLSVAGFPERSVFDQLSAYVRFLYRDSLVAEIYRTASELLGGPMVPAKLAVVREAAVQGGRELARSKTISTGTLEAMMQPLTTFEKMAPMGNLVWKTCIAEKVTMGQFQKRGITPRPDSIESFLEVMRIGFRPRGDTGDDYTIQFSFTGEVTGDCHVTVRNDAVVFGVGTAKQPGLSVHTPFDIWMDILTGKRDGQKAFLDRHYTIDGDFNLLLKMSRAFGREDTVPG